MRGRPQSAANKGMMQILAGSRLRLDKSKSKKSYISREEMMERLHYFQSTSNHLSEENIRLKTRIKFLEKDSIKSETDSEKSHLVSNLRLQIKDQQKIIENKEVEIAELKKNSRATKMQEIDVEMKMYIDECTRLQRLLQEAYFQLGQGISPADLQQKFIQQSLQLKALKRDYKEIVKMAEDPPLTRSKTKKELTIVKLKKNLLNTKEQNLRFSEDNQRLVQELNSLRQNFRCQNCGFLVEEDSKDVNLIVWEIWQAIEHRKLDLEKTWNVIRDDFVELDKPAFAQGLEKLGIYLSPKEVDYFFPDDCEKLNFEVFYEIMTKLRPDGLVSFQDVKETLNHLSFRLQVRRYEYGQVSQLFFNEPKHYKQGEVFILMQHEPALLNEIQAEMFTKFIFGSSDALSQQECTARFYEIVEPWQVLTENEESLYDVKLKEIVQRLGETLIKSLQVYDSNGSGFMTGDKFYEVLKRCKVEISEPMKKYLNLLFYTDQMQFNVVPYRNFFQAYNSQN
jgi:hypothetical protein